MFHWNNKLSFLLFFHIIIYIFKEAKSNENLKYFSYLLIIRNHSDHAKMSRKQSTFLKKKFLIHIFFQVYLFP